MAAISNTSVSTSKYCCHTEQYLIRVVCLDWPPHQRLLGHAGRVNCLLYPNHIHDRYDKSHLLSGGIDFAVCLWDLYAGSLLHRFCVHAGEITQLLVPPNNTSVSAAYYWSETKKTRCSLCSYYRLEYNDVSAQWLVIIR